MDFVVQIRLVMEEEIWKDVVGFEGYYQVSTNGDVKSLDRLVENHIPRTNGGSSAMKGKLLKRSLDKHGYWKVDLCINAKRKHKFIHRLIADAFIPNPNNYAVVNHKDGDKTNNNIYNLEWCTLNDNIYHAYNSGLMDSNRGETHKASVLFNKDIPEIRTLRENGLTLKQIGSIYGCSYSTIGDIINKKTWKHI